MTEDRLNSIIQFLIEHNIDAKIGNENSILFPIIIENKEYFAECILTNAFPYEIPEIRATDELFEVINGLPHVSFWKTICTFDETTTVPNFDASNELVLETIKKAIENINNGLLGLNEDDYNDEFKSYWANHPNTKRLFLLGDDQKKNDFCWYNNEFVSYKKDIVGTDAKKGLIVDVRINHINNLNFCNFVNLLDKVNRTKLLKFLDKNYLMQNLVLIRNHIGKKIILEGLFTPDYKQLSSSARGHSLIHINNQKDRVFIPVSIVDTTQHYLYTRGGVGVLENIKKVAMIGCGSFGSYLCESLMEYGIADFLLIDNQILSVDNVARHYCGFEYVDCNKADAVADKLHRHNPNIVCESFKNNVHDFLNDSFDRLNKTDVVFVAIGNVSSEKHIFDFIESGRITKPVVFIWGEPYCIACHALIINKNQSVFSLLYDSKCNFVDKVVNNTDDFFHREAGCRSTYIPYSAYMIKRFVNDVLFQLFSNNLFGNKNYSLTWLGEMEIINKVGAEISDEYAYATSFTTRIKVIS